jgi:hypothetical protein
MNGKIEHKESFNKVKIFKPKAVRLCPPRRKQMNSTFTQSNYNQGKKVHKANKKQKKKYINLEDISIDEINKDFKIYKDNMEEEHCHNELLNIINNSCENKNGENNQKIKRCKAPNKINSEFMKDSYFSSLINEFNNLFLSQTENVK